VVSYSLFIIHPFYILANFPQLGVLIGSTAKQALKGTAVMPWWYLPTIFLPGVFTWAIVSFLLLERPGMQLGKLLISRTRGVAASPVPQPATAAAQSVSG
jgi:peptidoglycan/LPS O-acetylase OafA/YrhL